MGTRVFISASFALIGVSTLVLRAPRGRFWPGCAVRLLCPLSADPCGTAYELLAVLELPEAAFAPPDLDALADLEPPDLLLADLAPLSEELALPASDFEPSSAVFELALLLPELLDDPLLDDPLLDDPLLEAELLDPELFDEAPLEPPDLFLLSDLRSPALSALSPACSASSSSRSWSVVTWRSSVLASSRM
jgi:hypothetical protein